MIRRYLAEQPDFILNKFLHQNRLHALRIYFRPKELEEMI